MPIVLRPRLLVLAAVALLLAACTPPTPDPVVTITSGATAAVDGSYTLTGTVTPAAAIARVTYTLNAGDEVDLAVADSNFTTTLTLEEGQHTLAVTARTRGGRTASASTTVTYEIDWAFVVLGNGDRLELLRLFNDRIETGAGAALPSDLTDGQTIFGVRQHPTRPWLYATSMLDEWYEARLDRFEITAAGLEHRDGVTLADISALACEQYCAPTELTFSPDGTRLYLHEDDSDVVAVFAVDLATGALEFLFESADNVFMQGLTHHPSEPYLYNGGTALLVSADAIALVHSGDGGNANTITQAHGQSLMYATGPYNESFAVYDLTDPAAPSLVDEVLFENELGDAQRWGHFLAVAEDGARVLVVGRDRLATYAFDGSNLAELDAHAFEEANPRVYRGAAWVPGSDRAIATWFNSALSTTGPGGYTVVEIASDGSLSIVVDVATEGAARAAIALR